MLSRKKHLVPKNRSAKVVEEQLENKGIDGTLILENRTKAKKLRLTKMDESRGRKRHRANMSDDDEGDMEVDSLDIGKLKRRAKSSIRSMTRDRAEGS
jgi:hypothetical protein